MHPWALLPQQKSVDLESAKERERLYRDNFRYVRSARQPEFCAPWVLGQRLGWRICSPIDVTLTPLPQIEISADDVDASVTAAGKAEVWLRSGTGLVMDRPPWLHLYQFRDGDGWGNMFIPNGQGSVEWRLGWLPEDYEPLSLMVFASEELPELGVVTSVLTSASLKRLAATGFSLAIHPRTEVSIRRSQEIARMVLLGPESLRMS